MPAMGRRAVIVNDRMQRGYRYELTAPIGRDFDPEFAPELTPRQMLELGVFGGKYLTDCARRIPRQLVPRAKLSPQHRDRTLNFFGVDASQPLSVWRAQGLDPSRRSARLVPMVLPLLHGPPHAGGRRAPDQAMEGDATTHQADQVNCEPGTSIAAGASARRCFTGPMTAAGSETERVATLEGEDAPPVVLHADQRPSPASSPRRTAPG